MGILLKKMKIQNYKSIEDLEIDFNEISFLIGQNNSGKTSIAECVELALNFSRVELDCFHKANANEAYLNCDILIDVIFLPTDESGEVVQDFDIKWQLSFGDLVSFFDNGNAFVAFRTKISYNKAKEVVENVKFQITSWIDDNIIISRRKISRYDLEDVIVYFLSASRDIFLDIRNRNSTWSRVTSNIKIPDDAKKGIQNKLDDVNSDIVTNSIVLSKLKNNMINTNTTVEGNVSISPLTKDIESLYKGMNLYYNLGLNTDIPVENLGMGTRSWAVFSTLKTSIELEYEKRIKENLAISTLFIVEEPEAHIHPQGQMSLIKGIKEVKAQKFITTHSQMMLSIAELADLKFVYLEKGKTKVVNNIVNGLLPNEVKKIYDKVLKPRGEIVFANQVIFCEGLSDEIALSYFYKTYFEVNTYEKGISIINVGGKDGYKPFLHIVKNLKIEWSIFSDGEKDAINSVNSAVYKVFGVEKNEVQNMDNVITLNGGCLESYLINDGYYSEILNAVNSIEEVDDYLRSYIDEQQGQKRKGGSIKNYNIDNGDLIALEDLLVSNKLKYIDAIVQEISKIDNYRRVPTKFRELFDSFNGGGETNGN